MRINNVDNTNFKAIYRLKNTPTNLETLGNKIIPIYEAITKQDTFVFIGSNPFKSGLDFIIKGIAQANNVTKNWLKKKAEYHGLEYTSSDDGILHVITTQKDIDKLNDYMQARLDMRFERIKDKILNKTPLPDDANKNLPEYLQALDSALKLDQVEEEAFKKYPQKIIEVNNVEELFAKMMSER